MPASSDTLITAALGRIAAVSSSNQTTSAAWLNWLIIQPGLTSMHIKIEEPQNTKNTKQRGMLLSNVDLGHAGKRDCSHQGGFCSAGVISTATAF